MNILFICSRNQWRSLSPEDKAGLIAELTKLNPEIEVV